MEVKYYEDSEIERNRKSIFLAGPTPRSEDVEGWRAKAIEILGKLGFDGDVFVPETKKFTFRNFTYEYVVNWELEHLDRASVICFWVPREMKTMPALTTNVEFGYHLKTGKVVYGRPDGAEKTKYLDFLYERDFGFKPNSTLEETLKACVEKTKLGESKIYFTSDTHFGSERTLKLSQRPFKNVNEMDKTITRNWNYVVNPNDIVYHVGDFGEYSNIKKLNGKVVLILGNYEKDDLSKNYNGDFEKFRKHLIELGFEDVIKNNLTLNLPNFGETFLTHEPIRCQKDKFNLFGHVHKLCLIKEFGVNVGTDNFNYRPASLEEIEFYKNGIKNFYDENIFMREIKN